ncbi:hypothetical protein C1N91_02185 [Curtobacterium sp. SGAir0471]|uniref:hypothetical protein n=1 Tax=Curtobacterium sp. SGAir0471 TaxID=2070337 RepID=UPI0010CD3EE4|nr:hypothetical protein [Curtobacterium sp. SGAir0471]QCR42529.1 hypothetical protein C1N91_02185 [Curtobacterium sp. SGAir0471]
MTHTPVRSRVTLGTVALFIALPLTLSACSTPDAGTAPTTAAKGIGTQWGDCMRAAGFDVEDPDDDAVTSGVATAPQGVDQHAFAEQAGTCSRSLGVTGADDATEQKFRREYQQVASCIRERGYPDFPEQDGGFTTEGYPRSEEPEFDGVVTDCMAEYSPDSRTAGR